MVPAARHPDPRAAGTRAWPGGQPAIAVAAAIGTIVAVAEVTGRVLPRGPSALLVLVFTVAAVAPCALARDHPVAAAATTVAASGLLVAYDQPLPWAVAAAAGATAYVLARSRPWRAPVALVAAYGLIAATVPPPGRAVSTVAAALAAAAGAGLGAALRWRERAAWLTATAEDAERTLLEHVTLEERARIARELHDVVAHHISMIAVQADAARLLVPGLAPDGQQRLVEIGDTARAALTEMRRLLGVLREGGGAAAPARSPQPGLHQLAALVDEARAVSGASIRLIVRGPVAPLDPGVELTAYRIVQEALTNARRHAPGAAVDIELDYRPDALVLRVRDNGLGSGIGAAPGARAAGHGLEGMRERTAMLGGRIATGLQPDGGFAVSAVLPGAPAS
ncbi:MAG TPA: sensor histidine kinase [Acidimicrobiales bacterium]|nr:sensor histidine kinase [Acidimicrobiales bacterium]